MLMSYFVSRGESGAVVIQVGGPVALPISATPPSCCRNSDLANGCPILFLQALGVVSNFAMLTQIFLAGFLPTSLFQGILGITILSLAINSAKVGGPRGIPVLQEVWASLRY